MNIEYLSNKLRNTEYWLFCWKNREYTKLIIKNISEKLVRNKESGLSVKLWLL